MSLVAQLVKNPPAMQETLVWSLGWDKGHMQVLTCSKSQHTGNDLKGGLDIPPDLGGPTGTPPDNTDTGSSHSGELVSTMGALIWNPPSSLPTPGA